jgi:hypothetical protein
VSHESRFFVGCLGAAAPASTTLAVPCGFLGLIVAQVAAGECDEDVLEADLTGRQPDET